MVAVLTKRIQLRVAGKLSHSTKDLRVMGRRELGNEWVGLDRSLDVKWDDWLWFVEGSELATAIRHKYLDLGELQSSSSFHFWLWIQWRVRHLISLSLSFFACRKGITLMNRFIVRIKWDNLCGERPYELRSTARLGIVESSQPLLLWAEKPQSEPECPLMVAPLWVSLLLWSWSSSIVLLQVYPPDIHGLSMWPS